MLLSKVEMNWLLLNWLAHKKRTLQNQKKYKESQYKEMKSQLLTPSSNLNLILLEITSLSFVKENVKAFTNFLKSIGMNEK